MGRGRVILANAFSPSMLFLDDSEVYVAFRRLNLVQLTAYITRADECVIGHPSTVALLDELTNNLRNVPCERREVKLRPGDTLVIITLAFRPPEGKVYSYGELLRLYEEGKIAFYEARVLEAHPGEKIRVIVN